MRSALVADAIRERECEVSGSIAYIVVFLFTFFAACFVVARCCSLHDPTDPGMFLLLLGLALVWPVTVLLSTAGFILFVIARLAEILSGRWK